MQYPNEILFLVASLILWGLVAASKPLVNQSKVFQPENYGFLAFVFTASAFTFFALASTVNITLLTLANTCLVAGTLFMALFTRALRRPLAAKFRFLSLFAILLFGLSFEYLRQTEAFAFRVVIVVLVSSLCLIWQLIELGQLGKYQLKKLKLFLFATIVQLTLALIRFGALFFQKFPSEMNLYQEPFEIAVIRCAWFAFTVISYVALIGYWIDRLSIENARTTQENISIKLELANKKFERAEMRLLTTIEEAKSVEVKLDVTQKELIKREQQLRYVLSATGDGIWDWNILTGQVEHNSRWIEMLDENPSQNSFSIEDFKRRIHPDDLEAVLEELGATLDGLKEYRYRYRMVRRDGRQIWVEDKGQVVEKSQDGKPIRMVGAISDISDEVDAQEKLQALAFYDPLTQLLNRRLFSDRLDQVLKNTERRQQYAALLIIDLDHFKDLNDAYGHQFGDLRLMDVAKLMKENVREIDTVARLGGDEFAIILSELGGERSVAYLQAKKVAEKLCQSLSLSRPIDVADEKLSKPYGSQKISCSASIGGALFLGGQLTQDELISQADSAMYQAKKFGGNQVQFYDLSGFVGPLKTEDYRTSS